MLSISPSLTATTACSLHAIDCNIVSLQAVSGGPFFERVTSRGACSRLRSCGSLTHSYARHLIRRLNMLHEPRPAHT